MRSTRDQLTGKTQPSARWPSKRQTVPSGLRLEQILAGKAGIEAASWFPPLRWDQEIHGGNYINAIEFLLLINYIYSIAADRVSLTLH
jgi:hypothetical protein